VVFASNHLDADATTMAIMIIEMKDERLEEGVGPAGFPAFLLDVVDDVFGFFEAHLIFDREGLDGLRAIDGFGEPADETAVGVAGGPPFLKSERSKIGMMMATTGIEAQTTSERSQL
jgi:hypothetical protein